jgi:hypothetical protein
MLRPLIARHHHESPLRRVAGLRIPYRLHFEMFVINFCVIVSFLWIIYNPSWVIMGKFSTHSGSDRSLHLACACRGLIYICQNSQTRSIFSHQGSIFAPSNLQHIALLSIFSHATKSHEAMTRNTAENSGRVSYRQGRAGLSQKAGETTGPERNARQTPELPRDADGSRQMMARPVLHFSRCCGSGRGTVKGGAAHAAALHVKLGPQGG